MSQRSAKIQRETKETQLTVDLNLDGEGAFVGEVGVPFLEHMLNLWTRQSFFDLTIAGQGDVEIDAHHTVEDLGITLGQAFREAVGDKKGVARYGEAHVPMDEALAFVALDLSNRPYLVFRADLPKAKVGEFDVELVEEFLRALCVNAGLTCHVELKYGANLHHCVEAIFKALGRALGAATALDPRVKGVHSTKGAL